MGRVRADGAVRRGDRERFRDRPATPAGLYDGPSAVSAGGVSPCAPAECLGTTWRSTNGNVMAVDDDGEGDVAGGEDERSAVRTHRGRMRGEGRASPGRQGPSSRLRLSSMRCAQRPFCSVERAPSRIGIVGTPAATASRPPPHRPPSRRQKRKAVS